MFGRGRKNGDCAAATLVLALALGITAVHAEGFLEFLFGPFDGPPRASSAAPSAPTTLTVTPRRSAALGHGSSFCVRLCDGRYFPMQRNATAKPDQMCGSLCPASETKVFAGTDISRAVAADGTRYANLKNAFAYRKTAIEGCTCNGRTHYGLATLDAHDDPTLRAGDLVVTANGLVRATPGGKPAPVAAADDVETTASLPSGLRGASR